MSHLIINSNQNPVKYKQKKLQQVIISTFFYLLVTATEQIGYKMTCFSDHHHRTGERKANKGDKKKSLSYVEFSFSRDTISSLEL